jgi:hypothetical protein
LQAFVTPVKVLTDPVHSHSFDFVEPFHEKVFYDNIFLKNVRSMDSVGF